jgi:hypothetical protein
MRPFDTVFMAIAVGQLSKLPRHWWLAAVAPVVSFVVHLTPFDRYEAPATALIVCLLVPKSAPSALLLAMPDYREALDVLVTALVWLGVTLLLRSLGDRLDESTVPERLRGLPARLFCLAVLYYTLLPVSYL